MDIQTTEVRLPSGKPLTFESSTGGEAIGPAAAGDHATVAIDLAHDVIPGVTELASAIVDALAATAGPSSLALELGIKFGGKTGFIVAEGSAEANLKLTLTWKRD